jgi:hypothetical protein
MSITTDKKIIIESAQATKIEKDSHIPIANANTNKPASNSPTPDTQNSPLDKESYIVQIGGMNDSPPKSDQPSYVMIVWDDTQKKFIKQMIDRGRCYVFLYDSSFRLYKALWLAYMIPVLVITTFSGVANLGQLGFLSDSFNGSESRVIYPIVLGVLNIIAAILTSLMQFLKISELKEAHRRAGKDWVQFVTDMEIIFFSQFSTELRNKKFNKMIQKYKVLLEKSPSIHRIFLNRLYKEYSTTVDLVLPEIAADIKPLVINL